MSKEVQASLPPAVWEMSARSFPREEQDWTRESDRNRAKGGTEGHHSLMQAFHRADAGIIKQRGVEWLYYVL